jgi:hypothetical protein
LRRAASTLRARASCGEQLRHARPVFTMGERSVSLLLHYVDVVLEGRLF